MSDTPVPRGPGRDQSGWLSQRAEVADHLRFPGTLNSSAIFCSVIPLSLTRYNPEVEDP